MNKKNLPDLSELLGGTKKPEPAGVPVTMEYVTTATVPATLGSLTPAKNEAIPVSAPGRKQREARRPSPNPAERWTRATFVIREQCNDDLRDLAWYKHVTIKELLDEALDAYLQEHETELKAARRERKKFEGASNA